MIVKALVVHLGVLAVDTAKLVADDLGLGTYSSTWNSAVDVSFTYSGHVELEFSTYLFSLDWSLVVILRRRSERLIFAGLMIILITILEYILHLL
jgi:hypothetical protein